MPEGIGKYDQARTDVREATSAKGVLLIILDGNQGNGFSAQFEDDDYRGSIPSILRQVADQIEEDEPGNHRYTRRKRVN